MSAAESRFSESGYDATTIEQIAAEAGVSPGTVYNYFGTKGAILLAVVAGRSAGATHDALAGLDHSHTRPVDATMVIAMTYLDPILDLDRALIAEVFGAGFDPSRSDLLAEFEALDRGVLARLADLFAALADRGEIGRAVDPGHAANVVFALVVLATISYVTDRTMARDEVAPFIRLHVELAFRGLGA